MPYMKLPAALAPINRKVLLAGGAGKEAHTSGRSFPVEVFEFASEVAVLFADLAMVLISHGLRCL